MSHVGTIYGLVCTIIFLRFGAFNWWLVFTEDGDMIKDGDFIFRVLIVLLQVYWEPHSPLSTDAKTQFGRAFSQMQAVQGSTAPGLSCRKTLLAHSKPQLVGLAGFGAGQAATLTGPARARVEQPTVGRARSSVTAWEPLRLPPLQSSLSGRAVRTFMMLALLTGRYPLLDIRLLSHLVRSFIGLITNTDGVEASSE